MGHAPEACVVIEDSPTGARAASGGDALFRLCARGDGAKLAAEGAQVFRSMDDLPALLGL